MQTITNRRVPLFDFTFGALARFNIHNLLSRHQQVITVLNGQFILAPLSSENRGGIHWHCAETKGWLGFRNLVT